MASWRLVQCSAYQEKLLSFKRMSYFNCNFMNLVQGINKVFILLLFILSLFIVIDWILYVVLIESKEMVELSVSRFLIVTSYPSHREPRKKYDRSRSRISMTGIRWLSRITTICLKFADFYQETTNHYWRQVNSDFITHILSPSALLLTWKLLINCWNSGSLKLWINCENCSSVSSLSKNVAKMRSCGMVSSTSSMSANRPVFIVLPSLFSVLVGRIRRPAAISSPSL